jgi:cytochrome c biogenesis protein CcdA
MATNPNGVARDDSPARRRWQTLVGVVFVAAGIYLCFAGAVIVLLALTDITGFLTDASSIALLLILVGSGAALGLFGLRLLRRQRDRRRV